ncbi:hypothetical protein MHYP_G00111060 [Metynnis hypsauchen]
MVSFDSSPWSNLLVSPLLQLYNRKQMEGQKSHLGRKRRSVTRMPSHHYRAMKGAFYLAQLQPISAGDANSKQGSDPVSMERIGLPRTHYAGD